MKVITDEHCTGYSHAGHPERPERISGIVRKLRGQRALPIAWGKPGPFDEASILRAHGAGHLARLKEAAAFDEDTPYAPEIERHALASAGAALEALREARAGGMAFSLMRPPGHHASRHRAMGFCYLNNIAVAVLEALATGTQRVAVFDFDVHHGNGTEAILLNQPGAAFFSVHQSPCYPWTGLRNMGNNCFNYPLPPRTPRAEHRQVLEDALEQMRGFRPALIAVSAGFDAYARDPLGQMSLEAEDYYWLGQSLRRPGLPVFSLLEGGYSDDLPDLVLGYLMGLAGK